MSRGSIVFLSILGAVLVAHALVFVCVVALMKKRRLLTRGLLFFMFMLIPFTFPAAWIWHHRSPGPGPGILHLCSSVWLGFVVNFMMCLPAVFLAAGAARLLKRRFGAKVALRLAFGLGLCVTLFGMINAKFPRVKQVEVRIRDLPANWEGKAIVQLTDVHLGMIHGNGFMRRVARRITELDPELVVITGDLFDGLVVDCADYAPGLRELRSRRGVFFVTGNHEGYHGVDRAKAALARTGIRVLDNEVVELDGLQIVGAGYPEFRSGRKGKVPFTGDARCRKDMPAILLYHTPTDLGQNYRDRHSQQLRTYFFPEISFRVAQEMGIDLQLSGHTHAGQTFPFNLLVRRLFGGLHRGLHRFGDFSIHISAGTGTWGPPMRVGQDSEITLIRLVHLE